MSSHDQVRLRVPSSPDFLGLAALCASRVGRSLGLDTADVAVFAASVADECSKVAAAVGADTSLDVDYHLAGRALVADGRCPSTSHHFRITAPGTPAAVLDPG